MPLGASLAIGMGPMAKGGILRPTLGGFWHTRCRHIGSSPLTHIRSSYYRRQQSICVLGDGPLQRSESGW
jgi:hypothetical protein